MSNSLWPHGLQHARLPCPSLYPGVCSDSRPLSQWCIQPSHPLLPPLLPAIFPSIRVFSNELALLIRWPKYWSFSFSIHPNSLEGINFFLPVTSDLLPSLPRIEGNWLLASLGLAEEKCQDRLLETHVFHENPVSCDARFLCITSMEEWLVLQQKQQIWDITYRLALYSQVDWLVRCGESQSHSWSAFH